MWPSEARFAASVTVDVDGEVGLPDGGRAWTERLSSRSERVYGAVRGVDRVLGVLAEFEAPATFYVPGVTAERHPDVVKDVVAAGHEIGHHGHCHLRPDTIDAATQREEIECGLAALAGCGIRPSAYRAPGWELTPTTLALLDEHGFASDSSLMADDRPYRLAVGDRELLELPVHWTLDDAPYFSVPTDPGGLLAIWRAELAAARRGRRHVTYTLHPDVLGRPHRVDVLRSLLDELRTSGAWIGAHGQVVAHLERQSATLPHRSPSGTTSAPRAR